MTFPEKLKYYRNRANLSQEELADKAGLPHLMYGKYERGQAEPGVFKAAAIAKALNVALDVLVSDTQPEEPKFAPETLSLVQEIEGLPSNLQKTVREIVAIMERDWKVQEALKGKSR